MQQSIECEFFVGRIEQPPDQDTIQPIDARHILESLPVAVYTTDLEGRITFFNEAAAQFAGRKPEVGIDKWCVTWKLFQADGTALPHDECPMATAVKENRALRGVEAIAERPDGSRVPFAPLPTPMFNNAGDPIGALNVLIDISTLSEYKEKLNFLANHDPLTNLPNREVFSERLEQRIPLSEAAQVHFGVIVINLDHFSEINDTFGHIIGDEVIRIVACRLRDAAPDCCISRKGGDEFLILVPEVRSPYRLVERIATLQDIVSREIQIAGNVLRTTFQAGVALYPDHGSSEIELVAHADTALKIARQDGRGAIQLYDGELAQRLAANARLHHDLQQAIGSDQLTLHYQPIADAKGVVVGFEALARWNHPELGVVPPDKFIPVAEGSGLILSLGRWVLESACKEASSWTNALTIAVNLSAIQFQHEDIPALINSILHKTGLASDRLELEITESVIIDDKERALVTMTALRNIGVKIALDDFGTGYSSLSYLKDFPFSKIKVDRSFVSAIGKKRSAEIIIESVIGLAHSLGATITAEGVETTDQLEFLANEQCDNFQGYLIGRPDRIDTMKAITDAPIAPDQNDDNAQCALDHESKRLAVLHSLKLLDSQPDEQFDRITRLAQATLRVPIALISLVDQDRQWFKSRQGLDATETPRNVSFCSYAIETSGPFIVPDASKDVRFSKNPLVTGDPNIKFYIGIPLTTTDGYNIGTLCAIDQEPRQISSAEIDLLNDMARLVVEVIELRRIATTDSLTGALTRRGFEAQMTKEWNRASRFRTDLSLIAIDLDRFKLVNDIYGHAGGDSVLQVVTQTIRQELRDTDFVGRLGGDEFIVVLPQTDATGAAAVAERIRKQLASTEFAIGTTSFGVTASFGVASRDLSDSAWTQTHARADTGLFEAKKCGRNTSHFTTKKSDFDNLGDAAENKRIFAIRRRLKSIDIVGLDRN